jgi:DNA-cytosine methyltransferase
MNVLSLFDGMSCGQIALNRLGFKIDNYFASEVDKFAIKVTQANFPNTIQLGDVREVQAYELPKIDLLIGGSPCQGFSFAGKQLNFEDPRSKLFFEYVRLLEECKPDYFLLENVKMKKESQDVISKYLGVEPIEINSALVSAQNRKRLYWTNIPGITQPEDKGILLKDILEIEPKSTTKLSETTVKRFEGYGVKFLNGSENKARCLSALEYVKNGKQGNYLKVGRMVGRKINPKTGKRDDYNENLEVEQRIELRKDDKSGCLSTVQKDNLVITENYEKAYNITERFLAKKQGTLAHEKAHRQLRSIYSKSNTLVSGGQNISNSSATNIKISDTLIRKLTPVECERLQTVPDNYTNHVSNTQRYKMLGNGWTVDVITHILFNLIYT